MHDFSFGAAVGGLWGGFCKRARRLLVCVMTMLSAGACIAGDATSINQLLSAGQYREALSKVDAALAQRPRDPQMMFLKGLILSNQHETTEAIAVFTRLTELFPALAEPYNNLAVLHAARQEYDKALTALQASIRANPGYATAYENLGDVYLNLAAQAYRKTLQLEADSAAVKSKLQSLRPLVSDGAELAVAMRDMAFARSPDVKPALPQGALVKSSQDSAARAGAAAGGAVDAGSGSAEDRDLILRAVDQWKTAWSKREIEPYFAAYSRAFRPPDGKSLAAWRTDRQAKIMGKTKSIRISVSALSVRIHGEAATVTFRQDYASGSVVSVSEKTLVFGREAGQWLIRQEYVTRQ